ncbi:putative retrotransposon protein, partial [Klebsormidium nitens]
MAGLGTRGRRRDNTGDQGPEQQREHTPPASPLADPPDREPPGGSTPPRSLAVDPPEDPLPCGEFPPEEGLSEAERLRRGKTHSEEACPSNLTGTAPSTEDLVELTPDEITRFAKYQEQQAAQQRTRAREGEEHRQAEKQWASYQRPDVTHAARERPPGQHIMAPPATSPAPRVARGQAAPRPASPEHHASLTFNQASTPPRAPPTYAHANGKNGAPEGPRPAPYQQPNFPAPAYVRPHQEAPPAMAPAFQAGQFGAYPSANQPNMEFSGGSPHAAASAPPPAPAPPFATSSPVGPGYQPYPNHAAPSAGPQYQPPGHYHPYGVPLNQGAFNPTAAPPGQYGQNGGPPVPPPGAPSASLSLFYTGPGYTATQAPYQQPFPAGAPYPATGPYGAPQHPPTDSRNGAYIYAPTGIYSHGPGAQYSGLPGLQAMYGPPIPSYGPAPPSENPQAPNKIFQAQKIGRPFKGTIEEEGRRARDFISQFEMTRRATPGLTNAQLVTTAIANLQDAAESWYFTEDTKYYQLAGANLVDDWESFKRLFLQRYGKAIVDAEFLNYRVKSQDLAAEATSNEAKNRKPKEPVEEKPKRAPRAMVRSVEDPPPLEPKSTETEAEGPRHVSTDRQQPDRGYNRDNRGSDGRYNNNRANPNGSRPAWNGQRRNEGKPRLCYGCGKPGHLRRECPHSSDQKGANLIEGECPCRTCHEEGDDYPHDYDPYDDLSDSAPDLESPASVNTVSAPCDGADSLELASDDTVHDAHLAEVYAAEEVADEVRRFLPAQRQPFPINLGPVLPPAPHGNNPLAVSAKATPPQRPANPPPKAPVPPMGEPTGDVGGQASSQAYVTNRPTVQGSFPLDWVPMTVAVRHGSPQLVRDLQTTVRKALQTLKRPAGPRPSPLSAPRAVETVNTIITTSAEYLEVDPDAPRRSIAKVAAKMGGVDGHRKIAWLDSVGTPRAMFGVIDYSTDLFRFKLPQTRAWRSLPLLEVSQVQGAPTGLIYQAPVAQTLTVPVVYQIEAPDPPTADAEPGGPGGEPDPDGPPVDSAVTSSATFTAPRLISTDGEEPSNDSSDDPSSDFSETSASTPTASPTDSSSGSSSSTHPDVIMTGQSATEGTPDVIPDPPTEGPPTTGKPITRAILLRTLAEARRLLRFCLERELLPRARVAMLAQLYTEGFEHHNYGEMLHPVDEANEALLPIATRRRRGFQFVNLTEAEEQNFSESFRAADAMPVVNATVVPPPPAANADGSDAERRAHREAVRPQIRLADNLDTGQREQVMTLLEKHALIVSRDPTDLGLVQGFFHHINTGDSKPVKMQPYRQSFAEEAEIDKQVGPMEACGVVQPSASPFAAAVVLARKKNGKWRFCVNFRGLNKVTVPDNYPLPQINAIFDQLGNSRYFTMLDAQSGYWQIPMAPEDIHKTAFITHCGLREFVRMPFGLTGAPATYQRVMDITLSDEIHGPDPVATQYLDDTCVHTEAWDKHLEALDAILTKLAAINLKLCPTKCLFGASEAEHLGHIVRENQLLPDPEKVKAVASWMTPINVSEVRAFLGMVGYYRHFVANFSRMAKPLHHLTKLGTAFEWSPEQARAFAALKKALCTAPILVRPNPVKPFIVDTDYSTDGIGAALSQVDDDGKEHPIAFASRSLHGAEVNYSTTDGELLAMVWAISVKFRPYLYGGPTFTCRVDHNPLIYLHQQRNLTGRLARWHMKLMEYNFTVVHRAGRIHSNVDPLSRHPLHDPPEEDWDDLPAYASFPSADLPTGEAPTVLNITRSRQRAIAPPLSERRECFNRSRPGHFSPVCPTRAQRLNTAALPEVNMILADDLAPDWLPSFETACAAPPLPEWEPDVIPLDVFSTYQPNFDGELVEIAPTVNYCEPSTDWWKSRTPSPPPADQPGTPPLVCTIDRARDVSELQGDRGVPTIRYEDWARQHPSVPRGPAEGSPEGAEQPLPTEPTAASAEPLREPTEATAEQPDPDEETEACLALAALAADEQPHPQPQHQPLPAQPPETINIGEKRNLTETEGDQPELPTKRLPLEDRTALAVTSPPEAEPPSPAEPSLALTSASSEPTEQEPDLRLDEGLQKEIELSKNVRAEPTEAAVVPLPTLELDNPPPFDLASFPTPDPLKYVIGDPDVAYYFKTSCLPAFHGEPVERRKDLRRQIRDRSKMYHMEGERLYRLASPKAQPNQPPPPSVIRRPVLTKPEADSV